MPQCITRDTGAQGGKHADAGPGRVSARYSRGSGGLRVRQVRVLLPVQSGIVKRSDRHIFEAVCPSHGIKGSESLIQDQRDRCATTVDSDPLIPVDSDPLIPEPRLSIRAPSRAT